MVSIFIDVTLFPTKIMSSPYSEEMVAYFPSTTIWIHETTTKIFSMYA
jgi:hypothetical protein